MNEITFDWDGAETSIFENDASSWTVASGSDTLFVGENFLECLKWVAAHNGMGYLLETGIES